MTNDSEEWVVLATLSWLQEAILLRGRLEGSGISTQIPEEHISSINPGMTAMQVRVLVRSSDLARAQEILNLPPESTVEESCASCGSSTCRLAGNKPGNLLRLILGFLFFIPMRRSEKRVCGACGFELKS